MQVMAAVWVYLRKNDGSTDYHDSDTREAPVRAGTDAYGATKFVEHRVPIVRSLEGMNTSGGPLTINNGVCRVPSLYRNVTVT